MVEEEGLAEDLDLDLDCPPPFMQRRREAVACRAPSQAVSTELPCVVGDSTKDILTWKSQISFLTQKMIEVEKKGAANLCSNLSTHNALHA